MEVLRWITSIMFAVLVITTHAQAQQSSDDDPLSSEPSSEFESGASTSFVSNGVNVLVIVLSVVLGVVVILTALYLIAKRRNWALRESIYGFARRITDAIKSPLINRIRKSDPQTVSNHLPRQGKRSSRGMTRITEWPRTSHNEFIERNLKHVTSTEGVEQNRQPRQQFTKSKYPDHSSFMPYTGLEGHAPKKQKQKQEFDLERGIELGSTENMKVTVSASSNSNYPPQRNWKTLLGYGGGR